LSDQDLAFLLRLHFATLYRAGLGELLAGTLGSAAAVFRQPRERIARVPGVTPRCAARLLSGALGREADAELRRCEREGVTVLVRGGPGYPRALAGLPHMPLVLFARGEVLEEDSVAVGVVGTRRPSAYGLQQARRFAARLAECRVTVVSGLARGIDAAAQEAALGAGGRSIAVLGSGLGCLYPPEHQRLADAMAGQRGAVVSEFPFLTPPRSFHFPQRNRVLSGLGALVLVVEAGERSGSLITVDWALQQGKSVYVVPGRVDQAEASGGLRLLQDGAALALNPEDLLFELGVEPAVESSPDGEDIGARLGAQVGDELAAKLRKLFAEEEAWHPDRLAQALGLGPQELLAALSKLELEGIFDRDALGRFKLSG
jgi:DNA processing protein